MKYLLALSLASALSDYGVAAAQTTAGSASPNHHGEHGAPRPAVPARQAAPTDDLEGSGSEPDAKDALPPHAGHQAPARVPNATEPDVSVANDHRGMPDMSGGQEGSGHDRSAMKAASGEPLAGTDLPAGTAPATAPPRDHYADRAWGGEAMAASRTALREHHGGSSFSQIMLNLAEVQIRDGQNAYRWDGEAWFGGDINRLTIKSEGEGKLRRSTGRAEIQALYSRAISPYWNLQGGVRLDRRLSSSRAYASVGVEGLAPYWFDIEAALFVSDQGDILGRIQGYHDMRLTQRLVLQPRAEFNISAQNIPGQRLGSGITDAEIGLRLRYEAKREIAPYVGVSWERKVGGTARIARKTGEGVGTTSLVIGMRIWF
ncbi:MAG: copper resistance protein B [Sphingobium sp.]